IDTRMQKLETEQFAAIVLAAAGIHRAGWEDRISEYLPVELCVPAVGQGALGMEFRRDDAQVVELMQHINDPDTDFIVLAERSFLDRLTGGGQEPMGADAGLGQGVEGGTRTVGLTGIVGSPDGAVLLKEHMIGTNPEQVGIELAEKLIGQGADRILEQ